MHDKSSPLSGGRLEVPILHVKISGTDGLRAQSVEQRHFGAGGDAQIGILEALLFL